MLAGRYEQITHAQDAELVGLRHPTHEVHLVFDETSPALTFETGYQWPVTDDQQVQRKVPQIVQDLE